MAAAQIGLAPVSVPHGNGCAGRPIFWAILRSSSAETYSTVLEKVAAACTAEMAETAGTSATGPVARWQPSCCLVDNCDAELKAIRHAVNMQCSWLPHKTAATCNASAA